jgi:hypothetical protein
MDSSKTAWLSHAPGMIRTCGLCLRTARGSGRFLHVRDRLLELGDHAVEFFDERTLSCLAKS